MKVAKMKYFGTDGIRNKAGTGVLSPDNLRRWGGAIAQSLDFLNPQGTKKVVIGSDTRKSGKEIVKILTESIQNFDIKVIDAGIITTPGVSALTRLSQAQAGIVISASHNPYYDNGIKIFGADGFKASEELELKIEEFFDAEFIETPRVKKTKVEKIGYEKYLTMLIERAGGENCFKGFKLVIDCANGASSQIAPELFERVGCILTIVNNSPDGNNINHNCGALEPENIASLVRHENANMGVTFDGDADRAIFLDENGDIIDGDCFLYIIAKKFLKQKKLKNRTVVGTIMSNLGLELALKELEVKLERTDVGDKYITRRMLEKDYVLGGEQSGHFLIFTGNPEWTTGDGLLSTIELIQTLKYFKTSLSKLASEMQKTPQITRSITVKNKVPLEALPQLKHKIAEIEEKLADSGRIVFRYSGTEPKVRIMLEGLNVNLLEKFADELEEIVNSLLN